MNTSKRSREMLQTLSKLYPAPTAFSIVSGKTAIHDPRTIQPSVTSPPIQAPVFP